MVPRLLPAAVALACSGLGCSLIAGLSDYHHANGTGGGTSSSTTSSSSTGGSGGSSSTTTSTSSSGSGTGGTGGQPAGYPGIWPDSASHICLNDLGDTLTGQACPAVGDPTYGQDGSFAIHEPTYTKNAVSVTDQVTGLTWQRYALAPANAADAATNCAKDATAGKTWRLPTLMELVSYLDMGRYSPCIDTGFYMGNGDLWTASPGASGNVWTVNFGGGHVSNVPATEEHTPLCVSGPAFSGSLNIEDANTAFDSRTGISWRRAAAPDFLTWPQALQWCENQNPAAQATDKGWRLPTYKELLTLLIDGASPAIDTNVFTDAVLDRAYWSSSPCAGYNGMAYAVDFKKGDADYVATSSNLAVLCMKTIF